MNWKTRTVSWIMLAVVLAAGEGPAATAHGAPQGEVEIDYPSTRREIQFVENAIDSVLQQTFPYNFALVQRPKGVYLSGYGVVFNFLINIHRAVRNTPFGEVRIKSITPKEKKRRLEELTEKLIQLLLTHGGRLPQIKGQESVTIVAYVEDRNFPEQENFNKTMILRAQKKDLEELSRKTSEWQELKKRMNILEY